jgi:hypothetical protein
MSRKTVAGVSLLVFLAVGGFFGVTRRQRVGELAGTINARFSADSAAGSFVAASGFVFRKSRPRRIVTP